MTTPRLRTQDPDTPAHSVPGYILKHLTTDPDLIEQAEKMAEKVRVLLTEHDDEFEDWIVDYAVEQFDVDPMPDGTKEEIKAAEEQLMEAEAIVATAFAAVLRPYLRHMAWHQNFDWR